MNEQSKLGLPSLVAFGLVFMIPISPVAIFGFVDKESMGLVPLVYLIGATAMLFTAMSYRLMSARYPVGGSVFTYVRHSLGNRLGFVTGWIALMDYILIPALVFALSSVWLQELFPTIPTTVWVVLLATSITVINCIGLQLTSKMSFMLLFLQLLMITLFVLASIYYLLHTNKTVNFLAPVYQPLKVDIHFIGAALSLALLNYLGFDGISTLAEDAQKPAVNIGRAIIISLMIISSLFILQTYMAALVAKIHPVSGETAFFELARVVGGKYLYGYFMFVNILSIGFASALVTQSASAKLLNVMAKASVVPASNLLAKTNGAEKTPMAAILIVGVFSLGASFLLGSEYLIHLVSFGGLTAYLLLNLAVIKTLLQEQHSIVASVWPLLGFLAVLFVWLHFEQGVFIAGLSYLILGLILYQISTRNADTVHFNTH